jgi:glycosyltransferase involved in cell wall biosynthesis
MFTNTYLPHVGGVARSLANFTQELTSLGHKVLIIAPFYEGNLSCEENILRIHAIQNFNGSDFSLALPARGLISKIRAVFSPDIIHSHHPFLLGDVALKAAAAFGVPILFTHHTQYEEYTHYVPGACPIMKRFVVSLVTGYCNLCNAVIAPSYSLADQLRQRGVTIPIKVIPTGVYTNRFAKSNGTHFRNATRIPLNAFIIGHIGRLAREKNILFLTSAIAQYMTQRHDVHFLVAGMGPLRDELFHSFRMMGLEKRFHLFGVLDEQDLAEAYHAMDVFVFASQTETQGIVLAESMTAGTPVVAIDAPGVRDIVVDQENGRLLLHENPDDFLAAIDWVAKMSSEQRYHLKLGMQRTAHEFSIHTTACRLGEFYEQIINAAKKYVPKNKTAWNTMKKQVATQWDILRLYSHSFEDALFTRSPH